jgi:phosphomannomutase
MKIFKAYDIRGVYGDNLNEDIIYKIGRAYVLKFKPKIVTVGYDGRVSSPSLFKAIVKGITDQGCDVVDIGLVSTPMMYFSSWNFPEYDGGLMVSASHNPPKYNGVKMVKKNSVPISGETGIYELGRMIEDLPELPVKKGSVVKQINLLVPYVNHSLTYKNNDFSKYKIVVDTANGVGGPMCDSFFKKLGCEFIHLFPEVDGTFPNHEANPLKKENNADLIKSVNENNADIGIGFDGDADRCGFVDEKGQIVPSDFIVALIAKSILMKNPGKKILYDVRCSKVVDDVIRENGGIPGRCHVGHSLVKVQMHKEGAYFAGELSSHFYLQAEHYAEAPFFVILKILELMDNENKTLSELVEPLKKYFHTGEINSKVENKDAKMKELAEKFKDANNISWLDGVTVEYDDWWFNVRPSNTEPYLRLNLEADTKELMEQKRDEVLSIIRST